MGQRARSYVVAALASLSTVACSTTSASNGGLAVCSALPADAGSCAINQGLLSCTDRDSGIAEVCLSDNANACPDSDSLSLDDCKSLCPAGEFAAACGGPPARDGGAPANDPPSPKCTSAGANPGGTAYWCCPCGS